MLTQVIYRDITERKRAEALAEVVRELANTLDYNAVAQKIADSVCTLLGVRTGNVFRLEPGTGNLVSLGVSGTGVAAFAESLVLPYGTGVSALALRERQPVFTPDLLNDSRISYSPDDRARMEQTGARAALAVPLLVQDRAIGAVAVGDRTGREFRDEEVQLLQSFADQAALALENARLFEEARRERERSESLFQVSNRLAGVHDTDEVLDLIVNEAARLLGADSANIRLLEGADLVFSAEAGRTPRPAFPGEKLSEGFGGLAITRGEPVAIEDMATAAPLSPEHQRILERATELGLHGYLAVPLQAHGRSIGVLGVLTKGTRPARQTKYHSPRPSPTRPPWPSRRPACCRRRRPGSGRPPSYTR
jgi:GAF domain-containing protein